MTSPTPEKIEDAADAKVGTRSRKMTRQDLTIGGIASVALMLLLTKAFVFTLPGLLLTGAIAAGIAAYVVPPVRQLFKGETPAPEATLAEGEVRMKHTFEPAFKQIKNAFASIFNHTAPRAEAPASAPTATPTAPTPMA